MAYFIYMFVSSLFQCCHMCLLEVKKKNSGSGWFGCFQGKIKWQSCAEKAISKQNTFCDMQHVDGWQGVKCVCFPFAFPFVLGKESAKNSDSFCCALLTCLLFLLLAQALASSGCCPGLNLRRLMPGDKSQGSCWSPAVSWHKCCLCRVGIHLNGQYWCLLSLNEEEFVKSSYS